MSQNISNTLRVFFFVLVANLFLGTQSLHATFIVDLLDVSVDELGSTGSVNVSFSTNYLETVGVNVHISDDTEGAFTSSNSITFSANASANAITVYFEGLSDNILDGSQMFDLSYDITSSNVTAAALSTSTNSITNADNTIQLTIANLSGDNVQEFSLTSSNVLTFDIQLNADIYSPSDNVTVYFSSNTSEIEFSGNNFANLSGSSNVETLTLVAVSDNTIDGTTSSNIYISAFTSSDANISLSTLNNNSLTSGDNFSISASDNTAQLILGALSSANVDEISSGTNTTTFSVQFNSTYVPTSNVTVYFSSTNTNEVTFAGGNNFVDLDGTTANTITLVGVNDLLVDNDSSANIYVSGISTSDANISLDYLQTFDLISGDNFIVGTNNQNEGLIFGAISNSISETGAGNTATFSVNTATYSAANVVVTFQSTDTGEVTIATNSTLVLDGSSANLGYVTVASVADNVIDVDVTSYITVTDVNSATGSYNGITVNDNVSVVTTNTDAPYIRFSALSGNTDESGTTATVNIFLDTIPTADVTVNLSNPDSTEFSINPVSVTLSDLSQATITITGVDDDVVDGDISGTLGVASVFSSDFEYGIDSASNLLVSSINGILIYNDDEGESVGVNISPSSSPTVNEGGSGTFEFSLTSQPTATVTISFTSNDTGLSLSPTNLSFASDSTFSTNQTVTYFMDDNGADEGSGYPVSFSVAVSGGDYGSVTIADQFINVTDDDSYSINFGAFSSNVREDGETATALVNLDAVLASGNIVLDVTVSDNTELSSTQSQLVFDSTNWQSSQTIEVTGLTDDTVDGDQNVVVTASVNTTLSNLTDVNYAAVVGTLSANSTIDVTDIDAKAILLTQTDTELVENTGITSLRVNLNGTPDSGDNVIVTLTSSENIGIDPTTVTFNTTNFSAFQSVSITSDNSLTGNVNVSEVVSANVTSATNYLVTPVSVTYTILDTDVAQYVIDADDFQTSEDGDTATFDLSLLAVPTSDITVTVTSSDFNEVTISPSTLTYTTANYNTPQTVTLTGKDDTDLDGLTSYVVTVTSTNVNYAGVSANNTYTNVDNDTASVLVDYDELKVSEWGSSQVVTITLGVAPTSTVDLPITITDSTEASLSAASLSFTSAIQQNTVTVTGLDDSIEDGNQFFRLDFSAMDSTDTNYDGLVIQDLEFYNIDNETVNVQLKRLTETTYSDLEDVTLTVQELDSGASTEQFTLKLLSAPSGNVVINLGTSDNTEATISPSQIVLTDTSDSATITLTGLTDAEADDVVNFNVTLDFDATTTDPNFSSAPQLTIAAQNESFDFKITDNPDLETVGGERIFDWLVRSDNLITFTAEQGLAPFKWIHTVNGVDVHLASSTNTYALDNFNSSTLTLTSSNSQGNLIVGSYTTSYSFTVIDSRDASDNTVTYDIYVQGDPLITSFNRPTLDTLEIFFEDLVSDNVRYYDVYFSPDVTPPTWTKINTDAISASTVGTTSKPSTISSLKVEVSYDGSEEGLFQLKATDAVSGGNTTPDIDDDILTDENFQVKYEVQAADTQGVTDPLDSSGGGCLLR